MQAACHAHHRAWCASLFCTWGTTVRSMTRHLAAEKWDLHSIAPKRAQSQHNPHSGHLQSLLVADQRLQTEAQCVMHAEGAGAGAVMTITRGPHRREGRDLLLDRAAHVAQHTHARLAHLPLLRAHMASAAQAIMTCKGEPGPLNGHQLNYCSTAALPQHERHQK